MFPFSMKYISGYTIDHPVPICIINDSRPLILNVRPTVAKRNTMKVYRFVRFDFVLGCNEVRNGRNVVTSVLAVGQNKLSAKIQNITE
jgi:hypothetical protein